MTEQTPHMPDNSGRKYWLDTPGNADKIFWGLVLLSVLLFLADALYHKHPYFGIEKAFGFYGVFGFCACVALIITAKIVRFLVMRTDNFYDAKTKDDS